LGQYQKGIGTCESNHRIYSYRMKKQGSRWKKNGKGNHEIAEWGSLQSFGRTAEKFSIRNRVGDSREEYEWH